MQLLQGEAFLNLFHSFGQTAYHLELRDSYRADDEDEAFHLFLNGQPDDYAWFKDWEEIVAGAISSGKTMLRARVVSEPHTDYTRWGLTVAQRNIASGEVIRYLPRHLIGSSELTTDDFWLFDDKLVAFTLFSPSDVASGMAVTTDPAIVDHVRAVWNRVWDKAVPHAEYAAQ